ncbi:MAG: hypothetical protein SGPRY_012305, partial [Prymnesium sp.]
MPFKHSKSAHQEFKRSSTDETVISDWMRNRSSRDERNEGGRSGSMSSREEGEGVVVMLRPPPLRSPQRPAAAPSLASAGSEMRDCTTPSSAQCAPAQAAHAAAPSASSSASPDASHPPRLTPRRSMSGALAFARGLEVGVGVLEEQ